MTTPKGGEAAHDPHAMRRLNVRSWFMHREAGLLVDTARASGDAQALALAHAAVLALEKLNSYANGQVVALDAQEGG